MVDYFDIRRTSPSVAFFFARLGTILVSYNNHCPWVGDFVIGDSSLGLVLGSLYFVTPILGLVWGCARDSKEGEHGF